MQNEFAQFAFAQFARKSFFYALQLFFIKIFGSNNFFPTYAE